MGILLYYIKESSGLTCKLILKKSSLVAIGNTSAKKWERVQDKKMKTIIGDLTSECICLERILQQM